MGAGTVTPAEWETFADPVSGVMLRQLTTHKTNSHHLYFTNPGWHAGGRKMLFGSDRYNRTNLYSIDLESGEIMQLTDLEPVGPPRETELLSACVNPTREEAYFWYDRDLRALDLETLDQRTLWAMPEGFCGSMINCTADGRFVCTSLHEDMSGRFRVDGLRGYVGFQETFEAKPESRIMLVAGDGSGAECVWSEQCWIGHVNTSPTRPNLLTFCHEGPWYLVDNRIWGLDLDSRRAWMIRHPEHGELVGHEYWHGDGETIGYHGYQRGGLRFLGKVRFDDTDRFEVDFPGETGHIHSNAFDAIVGDGGKYIRLWKWNGASFEGPRALAEHRSSLKIQQAHPHPRFTPDGRRIVFTTDWTGYCPIYEAEVPDFETLPAVEE